MTTSVKGSVGVLPAPRRPTWRGRGAHATLSAILALALCACGESPDKDEAPYVGPATGALGSEEKLAAEVDAILAASLAQSRESTHRIASLEGAGLDIPAREPILAPIPPLPDAGPIAPLGPREMPLGETITTLPRNPHALALTNAGHAIYSDDLGIFLQGDSGEAKTISPFAAGRLALDAKGARLLAQREDKVLIFSGDNFAQSTTIAEHPPGAASWDTREGQLLFARERIEYSASVKDRIDLDIYLYDLASSREREAGWAPFGRYAALGTLPAVGVLWGIFPQPHQVDPVPARLYRLDDGTPLGPLTSQSGGADIQPAAGANGHFLWIRTYRRESNTGRAMWKLIRAEDGPELQLTDAPTWHVAMSPSGEWGATVTAENGGFALRRFRAGDIPAQHQPAARRAAAWNAEVERARQVVGDLVLTLGKRPLGAALEEADFAPTLDRVPAADDFAAMAAALRAAMAKHYQVNDADPRVFLRRIDLWLDDAAPYLTEHPALILALGGAMAEALPANRGWSAETFTKALSQDVAGETWRRSLEFTLVMPMGAARERIASGLSLSATVAEIAARGKAPIHLVENLRAETGESLIPKEWKDAGLPASVADLTAIRPAMEKLDVANDALNVVALSIASSQKSPAGSELAIWTALRLARNNPADAEALTLLGDTLKDNFYTRAAAAVFRAAALLNPEDPYLRVQSGDALLALSDFDGARAEFAIARSVDTGGSYADQLDQRDTLVGQMEKSEKEGATP